MMILSAIQVYPVKSCRGIALTTAQIGPAGIEYDRQWMVVDAQDRFITQRTHAPLALVETALTGTSLKLSAPAMGAVELPLALLPGTRRTVEVWGDSCEAIDQGKEANGWLSEYLKVECRLVRMAPDWVRPASPRHAPPGSQVGFADAYPVLAISEASLADLNSRLPSPIPMNRFRPNLVVAGAQPFAEDRWHTLSVGALTLRGVRLCVRCKITTIDQATGEETGQEPLRTLGTYRRHGGGIVFGQNLVPVETGMVQVGDPVTVLQDSEPV